jgi:hypothetical protein
MIIKSRKNMPTSTTPPAIVGMCSGTKCYVMGREEISPLAESAYIFSAVGGRMSWNRGRGTFMSGRVLRKGVRRNPENWQQRGELLVVDILHIVMGHANNAIIKWHPNTLQFWTDASTTDSLDRMASSPGSEEKVDCSSCETSSG